LISRFDHSIGIGACPRPTIAIEGLNLSVSFRAVPDHGVNKPGTSEL
jgi:hypothetical protein